MNATITPALRCECKVLCLVSELQLIMSLYYSSSEAIEYQWELYIYVSLLALKERKYITTLPSVDFPHFHYLLIVVWAMRL